MSYADLGQMVKAKHPEYNDLSDEVLGQKMLAKYPQYQDIVDKAPTQQQPAPFSIDNPAMGLNVGKAVLGGIGAVGKAVVGDIAQTAIQMPRAFAAGVAGLTGNEQARADFSKPVNVPGLGEVKGLSANPNDTKQFGTQSAEQSAGQALGIISEYLGMKGVSSLAKPLASGAAVPTALKIAGGLETGAVLGGTSATSQALKDNKSAGDVATAGLSGTAIGGIIGGGVPAAAAGIKQFTGTLSKAMVNRLIRPLTKEFAFGKNPGQALLSEGIKGNSFDELASSASSKLNEVGKQIGTVLQEHNDKAINLTGATDLLDKEMENAAQANQQELFNRLQALKDTLTQVRKVGDTGIEVVGERDLSHLSPEEANQLKQAIGQHTSWTGQAFDKEINRTASKVYGEIKTKIQDAVPAISGLNERWGNLLSVVKSVQRAGTMYEAKNARRGDLTDVGTGIAAIIEAVHGDWKGAGGVLLADAARHVLGTPAASTKIASVLSQLSQSELAPLAERSPLIKKILQVAGNTAIRQISSSASQ